MLSEFLGKVCVVTGAAGGIGRVVAKRFHELGGRVAMLDVSSKVADGLGGGDERILTFTGDLTDANFIQGTVAAIREQWGGVDVLVNNAGITRDNLLVKMQDTDWDDVMAVNLKAPFRLCREVAPLMQSRRHGKIVNVVSVSWLGNIGQANYAASKAGLVGLTRTLALELGRDNINVNAVAPGLVDTDMIKTIPEKAMEKLINARPLRRIGRPEEIADAVVFLASDRAAYITGQVLHVDGGKSCGAQG